MEASYATELKWAGQDKRDSVASEVYMGFKWQTIGVRPKRERGCKHAKRFYIFKNGRKFNKHC